MNKFFYELPLDSYYEPKLVKIIHSKKTDWIKYFNFDATLVFPDILTRDPFYNWLFRNHLFKAGILRLPPHTIYNWHKDSNRGVCVNYLINHNSNNDHCFFRDKQEVAHTITELYYTPGTRFLFNNQEEHMVINLDTTRYLLTVEFIEDKNKLTYRQLLDEIKEEYEPIQKR